MTNNSFLWEDLYQETMLTICSTPLSDKLNDVNSRGKLKQFIEGVIWKIWSRKQYKTSGFYLLSNFSTTTLNIKDSDNTRDLTKQAVSELFKKMSSDTEEERLSAHLLWDVCNSNTHNVSKKNKTSDYQINRRIKPIIKDIKRKLDE